MHCITIDGVDYHPTTRPPIAVAVTTRNRPQVLADTLAAFATHSPHLPVIVVDDGSDPPATVTHPTHHLVRHPTALGIPAAKNRCLAELDRVGAHDLFLFDDDTRPVTPDWYRPYVESPEPHLQHSWLRFDNNKPVARMHPVHTSGDLVAYTWSMGCMLYLTRDVLHRVGGMRPEFGPGMHEHVEWSRRIHAAGLTTFTHQDVPNSHQLIWAGDRGKAVNSTLTADRTTLLNRNERLLGEFDGTTDYQPYHPNRDTVLSCVFTGHPDPQRKQPLTPDTRHAAKLLTSLGDHPVTVLCDFDTDHPQFEQVPTSTQPYMQRWISYRQHILTHPGLRYVWCVDATDVECLTDDPFTGMQPGTLYAGWEHQVVGCDWMRENHHASRHWIDQNPALPLINAGVIGGDRDTMLAFTALVLRYWSDGVAEGLVDSAGDMGFVNRAAHSMPHLVTGPPVTTLFKGNERNTFSRWKHK